jgi:hypothetical protein
MKRRLSMPIVAALLAAAAVTALLVNIFTRQQEALSPFYRVVELNDETVDPAVWGKDFPLQYDGYRRTVDQERTQAGSRPRTRGHRASRARRAAAPDPQCWCESSPRASRR